MLDILFGSKVRAKLLEWLYTHPGESFYVRQLEILLELDSTNISRELNRLLNLGIVSLKTVGNQKHYSVDQSSSFYEDLRNVVIKLGVAPNVLRSAMEPLNERIKIAFIYGSFARGQYNSESDLDLMVIGDVTLRDISPLLRQTGQTLGREINAACYTVDGYVRNLKRNGFLSRVTDGDKLFVIGDENDLAVMVYKEPLA